MNNLKIEPNTFAKVKMQLNNIDTVLADYSLVWNMEISKTKQLFSKLILEDDLNEKQIIENSSIIINLLEKLKRLSDIQFIFNTKDSELKEKLADFKKLLGI